MQEQADLFAPAQPPARGDAPDQLTLARFASQAYLDYAISVVKGRALPDVCDGQKPVQRRILYAMSEMGLAANAKPVKSARVVGDVLGKFHPHGDQAAYEALVRMAQDFSLRYPLIDGQGNFGSRDGDGAAAMRYTEARLTRIAELLMSELDEGTVDFGPNYDGAFEEPKLLPARLPFVLLNGASGIAVGMATEIPSHNLAEVAQATLLLMREPKATLDEVLAALPGPDFPGGGQLISPPEDIREVYASGRGSLKVRARHTYEELARGQWQLVVTELPPGTSAQKVLSEIEELTNPKVRAGKKALTPEQQQNKALLLSLLDTVRDESGKDAAVRLVFEPRSSRVDREEFLNTLLAHTGLEGSAPINLVMIGGDGRPRQKGLIEILAEWIDFRVATVRRRSEHRLAKVRDRIHILEGRQLVLLNIDEVIRIIRAADEPRAELMRAFALSERQAEDILEIRLRQLARLEAIKIEQELAQLRKDEAALARLLDSAAALRKQVAREIEEDAKKYGDARRTLIQAASRAAVEAKVLDEPVTVVISRMGFVRARGGHGHDAAAMSFKTGDALACAFECRTVEALVMLGSNGRAYSVPVAQLPSARGDGLPVSAFIELPAGVQIVGYAAGEASTPLVLATTQGYGFTCSLGDLVSRQKAGKQFLTLDEPALPLAPLVVQPASDNLVACLSSLGRLLVFEAAELRQLAGGGRGVILMDLQLGETVLAVQPCGAAGLRVSGAGRGGKPAEFELKGKALEAYRGKRARKGRPLDIKFKAERLARLAVPA